MSKNPRETHMPTREEDKALVNELAGAQRVLAETNEAVQAARMDDPNMRESIDEDQESQFYDQTPAPTVESVAAKFAEAFRANAWTWSWSHEEKQPVPPYVPTAEQIAKAILQSIRQLDSFNDSKHVVAQYVEGGRIRVTCLTNELGEHSGHEVLLIAEKEEL